MKKLTSKLRETADYPYYSYLVMTNLFAKHIAKRVAEKYYITKR